MIKILKSLVVLGIIGGVGFTVARSGAWFTDTESVLGNSIDTGTIDIAVDGQNPASVDKHYVLSDLKPSQHGYIDETITNVGSNPLNLFKDYIFEEEEEALQSEPKCQAIVGTWDGTVCTGGNRPTDLAAQINYDLRVELYDEGGVIKWWETIYLDTDLKKLSSITNAYLGMIPAGWTMKVKQSYHLDSQAGNQYQGERLPFSITFNAEQLGKSTLALENKEYVNNDLSHTLLGDAYGATLGYTVRDRSFNYTLSGTVPLANTKYWLVEEKDPWGTPGTTIGSVMTDASGNFSVGVPTAVQAELNKSLTNAKIWLVTDADWNETTNKLDGWHPINYLFETGLMDYYDADL